MRISTEDKAYIKNNIKALSLRTPKLNQSELCRTYKVSRPTIKKWLNEIRDEQIRAIEPYVLEEEMRILEEKSKRYLDIMQKIHIEYFHYWHHNLSSLINLFKLSWTIDKDVFFLKLSLYTKALSPEQKKVVENFGRKMFLNLN